jgi:hypothetical protein
MTEEELAVIETRTKASANLDAQAFLTDRRILNFGPDALSAAMSAVGRLRYGFPSVGAIDVDIHPEQQAVRFKFSAGNKKIDNLLNSSELAGLLIAYCIGARIPIPKRSAKTIVVNSGCVTFEFILTLSSAPAFLGAPDQAKRTSGRWNG